MMIDQYGNRIRVIKGKIDLKLNGKAWRHVGTIDDEDRTLHVTRNREKHLMRKNDSYGLNNYVIQHNKRFDFVMIEDNYGTYKIPVQRIIESGTFLHFLKQGFEKQIFIHLNIINQYEQRRSSEKL